MVVVGKVVGPHDFVLGRIPTSTVGAVMVFDLMVAVHAAENAAVFVVAEAKDVAVVRFTKFVRIVVPVGRWEDVYPRVSVSRAFGGLRRLWECGSKSTLDEGSHHLLDSPHLARSVPDYRPTMGARLLPYPYGGHFILGDISRGSCEPVDETLVAGRVSARG